MVFSGCSVCVQYLFTEREVNVQLAFSEQPVHNGGPAGLRREGAQQRHHPQAFGLGFVR